MVKMYENHLVEDGFYIFIIGISEYTGDFHSVPTPARSAYCLYKNLEDLARSNRLPVASISMLLAPTVTEKNKFHGLKEIVDLYKDDIKATKQNFFRDLLEFYSNKKMSPKATTLFYFCGHGLQKAFTTSPTFLIFSDFNRQNWKDQCFSVSVFPEIAVKKNAAMNHLFFLDTCRNPPAEETKFAEILRNPRNEPNHPWEHDDSEDIKNCFIFHSVEAAKKLTVDNFKPTPLVLSLCAALKGAALTKLYKSNWYITTHSLGQSLTNHMVKYNSTLNEDPDEFDYSRKRIGEGTGPDFKILEWGVGRQLPKCSLDIFFLSPQIQIPLEVRLTIEKGQPYIKMDLAKKILSSCYKLKLEPGTFLIMPILPKNCDPPKHLIHITPAEICPRPIPIKFE